MSKKTSDISETYKQILKAKKLKPTKRRMLLLLYLAKQKSPVSPNMIFSVLGKDMDLVTIYRNVEHFLAKDIMKQVDFGHEEKYYELKDVANDHHHLICRRCRKMTDFVGCHIEHIVRDALRQNRNFVVVDAHSLELFGYCKKCYNPRV